MKKSKAMLYVAGLMLVMTGYLFCGDNTATVYAAGSNASVGIASVLGMSGSESSADAEHAKATGYAKKIQEEASDESSEEESSATTDSSEESDLVMANVNQVMNVRSSPDEDAEKVGVLYKDCGGRILDRKDGWTKLQSGDLVGWAKDDYLLFGDDAKALSEEVGSEMIVVTADALRVRSSADESSDIYGILVKDNQLDIIESEDNGWIKVAYDDEDGYVQAEYVDTEFKIDYGETMAVINKRAKEEAERKAKLTKNTGSVKVENADQTKLLAALIQCEAGNQPYDGQLAVGAVVINRLKSGAYPNTLEGVIYASGQFTPALNGKVASVYAGTVKSSCMQAAADAIAGNTSVGSATHFRRAGNRDGIVIGNHVFW